MKVEPTIDSAPEGGAPTESPPADPADWPKGAVDLEAQDLPHDSAGVEWWYFHAHLRDTRGRNFSAFGSFFRFVVGFDEKTKTPIHAHFTTWSVTDPERRTYHFESHLEKTFLKLIRDRVAKGHGTQDPRIRKALIESLDTENFPRPDRDVGGPIEVRKDRLSVRIGDARFEKLSSGNYQAEMRGEKASISLSFRLKKEPVLHGDHGRVAGKEGERMFYYFVPRTEVSGKLTIGEERFMVTGSGWYDHEFGGHPPTPGKREAHPQDIAWNWCALQLKDGSEVTVYQLIEVATGKDAGSMAVRILPDGTASHSAEFTLTPTRWWPSVRTFERFPVGWTLKAPSLEVDLNIEASLDDQEFLTITSKPSFWEGQVKVTGHVGGKIARGLGYVERSGFATSDTLDDFFKAVSTEVRRSVAAILPLHPTPEEATKLFAQENHAHLLKGLDSEEIASTLIAPIRAITDRGGKAWRSYAALACCEALGADSRPHIKWLSLPEIIHSGSLIVDDVEDKSTVRRGGPAAHLLFGEPLALNAGTAAYFLAEGVITDDESVADKKKLRLIRLYFEGLRAGHAGQALDLHGADEMVDEAVASGDSTRLEQRIVGMYRLKTGAPAGILARMGAVAADGSAAQEEALGVFFENLGVAFQMVDDVLNLRGFQGKLKNVGEDLMAGKVTLPVALALGRLSPTDRERLIRTIRLKTEDPATVRDLVHLIAGVGALDDTLKRANAIVEESWAKVSPLLAESFPKVMLRAFCWYVLERHY